MDSSIASMVVRGQIIETDLVEFGGRGGDLQFFAPDPHRHLDKLVLGDAHKMRDLQNLPFGEILDYLEALGKELNIDRNEDLRHARELSYLTAPTTPPIIDYFYRQLPRYFDRNAVREIADRRVGLNYLEGWVEEKLHNGLVVRTRPFGARTLHIIAGNGPILAATTLVWCAITRSDCIIKAPSNDPFTGIAIGKTMCRMAPDHPITRHFAIAYWRGADQEFAQRLYQPHNVEKIIAWGGLDSIKHVTKYIQPGLELIALDPKRSISVVGREAFENEGSMREAAVRLASDIGGVNQVGCANSRVTYALCGTDSSQIAKLNIFAEYVYQAMMELPSFYSTKPKKMDKELKSYVDSLRVLGEDWYRVIGGVDDEGSIIVSQESSPVNFVPLLGDRTANLVPCDSIDQITARVDAYTQTVGIYPESLKQQLMDVLPLYGAQRFVSLGYALSSNWSSHHDSIDPISRMCKWIISEQADPSTVPPRWTGDNNTLYG
jgi:hypothetical protein